MMARMATRALQANRADKVWIWDSVWRWIRNQAVISVRPDRRAELVHLARLDCKVSRVKETQFIEVEKLKLVCKITKIRVLSFAHLMVWK